MRKLIHRWSTSSLFVENIYDRNFLTWWLQLSNNCAVNQIRQICFKSNFKKTLNFKNILFLNLAYWCLFSPKMLFLLIVFCAWIRTDPNNPAPSSHTKLLNLTDESNFFNWYFKKYIFFVPKDNIEIFVIIFIVKGSSVQNIAWA